MKKETCELIAGTEGSLTRAVNEIMGTTIQMRLTIHEGRGPGNFYVEATSTSIPLNQVGVARFMFREISFCSFSGIWATNEGEKDCRYYFNLHFDYHNQRGGSNGCEAAICEKSVRLILAQRCESGSTVFGWKAELV